MKRKKMKKKIKRVTIKEVEEKVLPLMIEGYNKRQSLEYKSEKNDRRKKYSKPPRISPI